MASVIDIAFPENIAGLPPRGESTDKLPSMSLFVPFAKSHHKPTWLQWLDQKLAQESSVLYVAFGSQAEISSQQLREIAVGLKELLMGGEEKRGIRA